MPRDPSVKADTQLEEPGPGGLLQAITGCEMSHRLGARGGFRIPLVKKANCQNPEGLAGGSESCQIPTAQVVSDFFNELNAQVEQMAAAAVACFVHFDEQSRGDELGRWREGARKVR